MTNEEFTEIAKKIVGAQCGWQYRLANKLGKQQPTISRYSTGKLPVPLAIAVALKGLLSRTDHP
jgi:hypothetical protein